MSKQAPLSKMDVETARETALIDLAYGILRGTNQPIYFRDLMQEVAKLRNMSENEINETIAMLYTEINIDGRFLCIGNNVWGLKRWYPVEKSAEKTTGSKKFVRKEVDDFEDDDDELFIEEESDEEEIALDGEDLDGDFEDVDVDDELEVFDEDEEDISDDEDEEEMSDDDKDEDF